MTLLGLFLSPIAAHAGDREDTAYDRIDGDLSVVVGLGATLAPRVPRPTAEIRLRYLDTIGAYCTYEDALGIDDDPRRVFSSGLELRPLFLARWLQGHELQIPRLDLAIDSFGLELGAFFAQPDGRGFGAKDGLQAGFGLELPLYPEANGPWVGLHVGGRWSDDLLQGGQVVTPSDRSAYLMITLQWHAFFGAHVVDAGDIAR